jgi:tungstate transport system permease protein
MDSISNGFISAFNLIITLNPELARIISLSLKVSGLALALAALLGIPAGAMLAWHRGPLKGLALTLMHTCMGLPPVVVGLFLYLLLSRRGPLGFIDLLYTPTAMTVAQFILAFPIVVSLTHAALVGVDPVIRQAAVTLGANPVQEAAAIIKEARYGIMAGLIAAFGRVTAEVGAVIIVGGNIAGYTRVMTTTIALETDKGNFDLAIALGIILLTISLMVNLFLHFIQRMGQVQSIIRSWD